MEAENICETHIVEMNGPDRVRARRFDVVREPVRSHKTWKMYLCRWRSSASLLGWFGWRRYKRGDVSAEELGFAPGTELTEGVKLPKPYLAKYLRNSEAFDRLLDREEALQISNLRPEELDAILEIVLKIDAIIDREVSKAGLIHVDGKKEFALGKDRKPVLVDSFGTLDEDRWWDAEAYDRGEIVQLSKEFVREHYIGTGHHEELSAARKNGTAEPAIPALPESVIQQTSQLYASMFERLTGKTF